jgi:hypothetical protein
VTLARAIVAILLLASPQAGTAQVVGRQLASGCIDVGDARARVTATGNLSVRLFAGPPNYASIAAGDAEERTFILELPSATCIDDGGDFAAPAERFVTVHVSSRDEELLAVLSAAEGRQVTVSGEGFAAHTGHHHAPLVILADTITVRSDRRQ